MGGGFHRPSSGAGKHRRRVTPSGPWGAGSQFASFSGMGEAAGPGRRAMARWRYRLPYTPILVVFICQPLETLAMRDLQLLNTELTAWADATNADERQVDWRFTTSDGPHQTAALIPSPLEATPYEARRS